MQGIKAGLIGCSDATARQSLHMPDQQRRAVGIKEEKRFAPGAVVSPQLHRAFFSYEIWCSENFAQLGRFKAGQIGGLAGQRSCRNDRLLGFRCRR